MTGTNIPKRVQDRFVTGLRKYQRIVRRLKERDISEADTVTVIKDILSEVLGYDKYTELTSEQQIRGTFCDLAIKIGDKVHYLAEVKSAGTTLADNHLRQVVNYGAHHGIEWVILTNAITWKLYRIRFTQPINWDEVCCFDIDELSSRSKEDLAKLYMLSRESVSTDLLEVYHRQSQIMNRHVLAEMLQGDTILSTVRREFRRLFGMKPTLEELRGMLTNGVLKRDTLDGEAAKAAQSVLKKAAMGAARKSRSARPVPPIEQAEQP